MNKFKCVIFVFFVVLGIFFVLMFFVVYVVDGIVNFLGNIIDVVCDINGQVLGVGNVINVDLGIVVLIYFIVVGINFIFQEFDLVFFGVGCINDKKVFIVFDQVINVDCISGNLMLMGLLKVKGVQIQIFNNLVVNIMKILLGLVEVVLQKVIIDKNMVILKYKVFYVFIEKIVIVGIGLFYICYFLVYE